MIILIIIMIIMINIKLVNKLNNAVLKNSDNDNEK